MSLFLLAFCFMYWQMCLLDIPIGKGFVVGYIHSSDTQKGHGKQNLTPRQILDQHSFVNKLTRYTNTANFLYKYF